MSHLNPAHQPDTALSGSRPPHPLRGIARSPWAFWLPLAFQSLLILWTPVQATYTLLTGKTVVLQTVPVDPYDLARGYYVTLNYDISNPQRLEPLPGWATVTAAQNPQPFSRTAFDPPDRFYLVLQAPEAAATIPPQPWTPVRIEGDRPSNLPPNQIALQGQYQQGRILYDLERYYIPEDQRDEINGAIANLQRPQPPTDGTVAPADAAIPFVVEIKVGAGGQAVPVQIWLQDQPFRF